MTAFLAGRKPRLAARALDAAATRRQRPDRADEGQPSTVRSRRRRASRRSTSFPKSNPVPEMAAVRISRFTSSASKSSRAFGSRPRSGSSRSPRSPTAPCSRRPPRSSSRLPAAWTAPREPVTNARRPHHRPAIGSSRQAVRGADHRPPSDGDRLSHRRVRQVDTAQRDPLALLPLQRRGRVLRKLSSGIAANPYLEFFVTAKESGPLAFEWVDDSGVRGSDTRDRDGCLSGRSRLVRWCALRSARS